MSDLNEQEIETRLRIIADSEKESLASESFYPKLLWIRGGMPRIYLFPPITDGSSRERLAWATAVISSVAQADELVFITDSYGVTRPTRTNGENWGPGSMQYAVENNTVDAKFVHEQLSFTVATKEGWCAMGGLPYERLDGSIHFRWDDKQVLVEDASKPQSSASGFFPEMMREAMATDVSPTLQSVFDLGLRVGLSTEARDLHMLCAAVKLVGVNTGIQAAIAATNEEEAQILQDSFGEQVKLVDLSDGSTEEA